MSESFPDIEIYLKRPALEDIEAWLDDRFGITGSGNRGDGQVFWLGADPEIECVVIENVVKGGYTSVWFRSDATPWATDRDCALEAFARLGVEVRASAGAWEEENEDADGADRGGWYRVTEAGESRVNWLA